MFPQGDLKVMQSNESINLQTFGFSIPGQPPVVGPFNVTDAQVTAAVQLFNLAAIRHYQALKKGTEASMMEKERSRNEVIRAVTGSMCSCNGPMPRPRPGNRRSIFLKNSHGCRGTNCRPEPAPVWMWPRQICNWPVPGKPCWSRRTTARAR